MKKIILLCTLFTMLLSSHVLAANYSITPHVALDLGLNKNADTSLYSISIGGKFSPNVGAEVSYLKYGESLNVSGFALDILGYYPTRHIIAVAGLGYSILNSTLTGLEAENISNDSGIRVMVGVNYRFTRDLTGRAMIKYTRLSEIQNPLDITFGLAYSF